LEKADVVIPVNDFVKRELVRQGVSEQKILIIPNAIATGKFGKGRSPRARSSLRREFGLKDDEVGLAFVGRLSYEKNLTTLLKAFANALPKFQRMKLLLVGDGPLRVELARLSVDLGIEGRVIFTGFRDDIERILDAIDVFVLPSYSEGLPTSLLEAMASGKAIIASDIPAIRDVLVDFRCAVPFSPFDADEIARAILMVCTSPKLRTDLGTHALEIVKRYDIRSVSRELAVVYWSLLNAWSSAKV
jgi:glycosyltransferase involved in cell wall biosynthesis